MFGRMANNARKPFVFSGFLICARPEGGASKGSGNILPCPKTRKQANYSCCPCRDAARKEVAPSLASVTLVCGEDYEASDPDTHRGGPLRAGAGASSGQRQPDSNQRPHRPSHRQLHLPRHWHSRKPRRCLPHRSTRHPWRIARFHQGNRADLLHLQSAHRRLCRPIGRLRRQRRHFHHHGRRFGRHGPEP